MNNLDLTIRSLKGLWVGDCIGNIGQLYFAHDILKALDEGLAKFGANTINPHGNTFQYSDDTEEAIVLVNHLAKNGKVKQDELAYEFAKRYFERDPDGEIFGYGLMTRKVLREIYEGKPWREANQTKPRIEGPSFVDNMIGGIIAGKSIHQSMSEVNAELKEKSKTEPELKIGSCGNGSAMRVAPLGAFLYDNMEDHAGAERRMRNIRNAATLQAEVTHCHSEGIDGSIAVTALAYLISFDAYHNIQSTDIKQFYDVLLDIVPQGQVWDGIKKSSELPMDIPLGKLIEILGNGTHVTCQDTVPLCVFLTIRALTQYSVEEMYEKVIIETCKCFGDVDTNCAIVGGMVGIISSPPEKWVSYCQPMEGVLGDPLPVKKSRKIKNLDNSLIKEAIQDTTPWTGTDIEEQAKSLWETEKVISSSLNLPQPTFEEVLERRKKDLSSDNIGKHTFLYDPFS